METTVRWGGEGVTDSTSPLTKGKTGRERCLQLYYYYIGAPFSICMFYLTVMLPHCASFSSKMHSHCFYGRLNDYYRQWCCLNADSLHRLATYKAASAQRVELSRHFPNTQTRRNSCAHCNSSSPCCSTIWCHPSTCLVLNLSQLRSGMCQIKLLQHFIDYMFCKKMCACTELEMP